MQTHQPTARPKKAHTAGFSTASTSYESPAVFNAAQRRCYGPVVLGCVSAGVPVLTEEVFFPAVRLMRTVDAPNALRLANDSGGATSGLRT